MRLRRAWFALAVLAVGCGRSYGPLSASDVAIFAPLPGQEAGVAYLSLENRSGSPVTLRGVSSPDFEQVAMHTTVLDGNMTQMQFLDSLTIAEHSSVEFAAGGRHIMLSGARAGTLPGETVTLQFHYGTDGLLELEAPLRRRGVMDAVN